MSASIEFPLQVEYQGMARKLVPFLIGGDGVIAIGLFFVLRSMNLDPPFLAFLTPLFLVVGAVVASFVLMAVAKPAVVRIERTQIVVTPRTVLGVKAAQAVTRSLTEFGRVELTNKAAARGACKVFVALRGKDGKPDVLFDPPVPAAAESFARDLAKALHLEVSDHA